MKKKMKIEVKLRPLPTYGDLIPLDEFIKGVAIGEFIDYDGHGYYATEQAMTDIYVKPSFIRAGQVLRQFTHIMWFNR